MSKQPPPAPTASAVGSCLTVIQIVGRPGTGSLPSTIAPPDHPGKGIVKINFDFGVFPFFSYRFFFTKCYYFGLACLCVSLAHFAKN